MPRVVLVAAAALAVGGVGTAGTTARQPLVGVLEPPSGGPAIVARLDPLSLTPLSRKVVIGEYHGAWSRSPDRSYVALARGGQGIGIDVVDLRTMRLVRQVHTGIAAEALAWLEPRRLVAALQRGGTVVVDPRSGKILHRRRDLSFPDASADTRDGVVMVFPKLRASARGMPLTRVAGAARLALVDAQGKARTATLGRIRLEVRFDGGIEYDDRAGLVVDSSRARAYVLAADAPVAEVDLRTMRVSYHGARSNRPRNVLARERRGLWLGGGRMLLYGRDFVKRPGGSAAPGPAGATLVDTATWRRRSLDGNAIGAAIVLRRLLVYGAGLHAYTLGGRRLFSLFEDRDVLDVQVAAPRAYVRTARAVYVVDVRLGKVVARIVPPRDLVDVISPRR
jgi:hypothetical protein